MLLNDVMLMACDHTRVFGMDEKKQPHSIRNCGNQDYAMVVRELTK